MSAPLSLHELVEKAKVLERLMSDGKIKADAQALRDRIEAGYAKVDQAVEDGKPEAVLMRAREAIAKLEDDLSRTERGCEIPFYMEQAFLLIARDALKWSSVPKASRLRVMLPDVFDLTIQLDNLPEEAPF